MQTFIVRVWVERTDAPHDLRGTVHDVETGNRHLFQSPHELLELLTPSDDRVVHDNSDG